MTRRQTVLVAVQAGVGLAVLVAAGQARLALLAALAAGSLCTTRARHIAQAAAILVCVVAGVALMYFSSPRRARLDDEPCSPPAGAVVRHVRRAADHPLRPIHSIGRLTTALRGC